MAVALVGSPSNSPVASMPSTPLLSSTPMATLANGQGSVAPPSGSKPPSIRSETVNRAVNVSPSPAATTKKLIPQSSAPTSAKSLASFDTQPVPSSRPANTPPATTQPANTLPANTLPATTQPANTQPANTQPANTQPANTPPATTQPANTPPATTQPANTPPVTTQPTNTPPANSPSATISSIKPPSVAVPTSPPKASSSPNTHPSTASHNPSSTSSQSSKATNANVSPNVSANGTTNSKSSSVKSLAQSLATSAANVTSAHTSTARFVPQVSTSDTLPFTSTTIVPSPTIAVGSLAKSHGFFSNRAAVGGVSFVVVLAILGLAGLIVFGIRRYRRRRFDGYIREPTLPDLTSPSSNDGDMHYRRASQVRALHDVFSAGASRPNPSSGRSIASDVSHAVSGDTHHSTSPIMPPSLNRFVNRHADVYPSQGYNGGHTNEYQNIIPFPPPARPFAEKSRVSVQSAVESSPSIYPPTLPEVADEDEEKYWRQHGFERIPHSQDAEKILGKHLSQQQPTPPESALGLWTNSSPTTSQGHGTSEENELVRGMDPKMEPTSVHKGSTAPIAVPPRLHLLDGRYPAVGNYTQPRQPW